MTPRVRRNTIFIGTDTATSENRYLSLEWLNEKNMHVIGPPGEGKTRVLLWLFQRLCRVPRATVVLMNPKGALARMARDWALGTGQTKRLIWFDPGDPDALIGYNPLWPNGLPVAAHAKAAREAIRSAWGQANLDATPQLARLLFLVLGVCRALQLTLIDAVQLLRSGASGGRLRQRLLPALARDREHAFFHESLAWFDTLTERRQDELGASTLARLEAFVSDPVITSMLTQPRSLDLGHVVADHKILLVNLEIRRPLALDDVRLLGRMVLNDLVSHVFARTATDNAPVYFILDECHQFLTSDLCQALDMGRELGLHVIAAHQNLDQLREEDESRRVYGSVMKSARVKMIFGDCAAEDLDILLRDAMIDQYDPMKVKSELTSLELDPVETSRLVYTVGMAKGHASGEMYARSSGQARSIFESHGTNAGWGAAVSSGHSSGTIAGASATELILPNGDSTLGTQESAGMTSGDFTGESSVSTEGYSDASGVQESTSETESEGTNDSTSSGMSVSCAKVPFYEYKKRRVVSSRTFESEQEYLTKCLQQAKAQPVGHFLLKLPKRPALFLRAPLVPDPHITDRQRTANMARVYAQSCYARKIPAAISPAAGEPYQDAAVEVEFSQAPPSTFLEKK